MATPDYDVIVVGSGFGGSVMTYRLAKAGLKVCLLERGKAYTPGAFPRSPLRMSTNFWHPSERLHGMFHIWSFKRIGGVVASGLGGGSLIYANVLLRKRKETFDPNVWPLTYDDLEPHYAAAEEMLNGQPYPYERDKPDKATWTDEQMPYNSTSKTQAMETAFNKLKDPNDPNYDPNVVEFELPKLAITFHNPDEPPKPGEPIKTERPRPGQPIKYAPPSLHERGRVRLTCQLCGECDIGCNFGSKNTLDLTYLSAAKQLDTPPTIKTNAEVKTLEPQDGGYRVHYVDHTRAAGGDESAPKPDDLPLIPLTSRFLVLSAGSFGSTYLLLKNAGNFDDLNETALGARFCGNGDFLTVVVRSKEDQQKNARPRVLDSGYGPVITSAIRFKDMESGKAPRYYYIEDSGYPELVNWFVEVVWPVPLIKRIYGFTKIWLRLRLGFSDDSDISEEISDLIGDSQLSSTTMPLLAMGHDTPDGKMSLTKKGRLAVKWDMKSSAPYFKKAETSAQKISAALHAKTFLRNPLSRLRRLSRVITVHPLGGCPMGRTPDEGVVDSYGEVFNYKGFYIADGSVIPGPVGPNPSLTIAACAGRFADHLIEAARREE